MNFNEELKQLLLTGHRGCDIVRYHSRRMDEFVCRTVADTNGNAGDTQSTPCFGVFATGGYGRSELAPHSDIDLMFLLRDRGDTAQIEDIYYRLLDSGIHISHCVRTPRECIEEGLKDVRTRTSLLDTRFIAGNPQMQQVFRDSVLTGLLYIDAPGRTWLDAPGRTWLKNQREFFAMRLHEMSDRHKKFGASVYLLQPNVKDSAGGLRDVHEALWLSKIALNFKSMADFAQILSRSDYRRLLAAWDFLLKVRIALHLSTLSNGHRAPARGSDTLSFNDQQTVATLLGISDTRYFSASERLLRLYYIRASTIKTITEKIRNIAGSMFVRMPRRAKTYRIDNLFSLSQNKIMINDEQVLKKFPHKIIDAYIISARTGKGFTKYLTSLIRKHTHLINKEVRTSRAAISGLMEIFRSPAPYASLQMMFNDGVLGRLIPELAPLRLLVVSEPYHIYTVDAHTMLAIKTLQQLGSPTGGYDKIVSLIYNNFKDKEILYMAVLFHDIGKAMGRWHSTRGYMQVKPVLDRLQHPPLPPPKGGEEPGASWSGKEPGASWSAKDVEFLVKNHLLLSRSAFTKDIDDHDTIAELAEGIRDERTLNALLLVTYADMSAVNPDFFTDWRKSLVIALYNRLMKHIRGIERQYTETYIGNDDEIRDIVATMPRRYLQTTAPKKMRREVELLRVFNTCGFALSLEHRTGNTTELTVLARDRAGLLSDIVGVLSLRALNILSLRTFASTNGYVIDRLQVSNYKELWWEGMDELIEAELRQVCVPKNPDTVPPLVVRKYPRRDTRIAPFLEVDNDPARHYTVFETISTDRIGLLHDIVSVFSNNALDIMMARVNTEMDIAHDVFFVTGAKMIKKPVETETIMVLMGQLWNVLN
ncbi:MAG: hypothetical protein HQL61_03125 [Magnetococcales bacterium]|nr:hypothetical protein [Nitrospirota bacterium]